MRPQIGIVPSSEERETASASRSAERIERILERSPDIVIRFDRDFRHLYISPAVEAATGFAPSHYVGRTDRELGMPVELCDFWDRELGAVFESGEPLTKTQLDTLATLARQAIAQLELRRLQARTIADEIETQQPLRAQTLTTSFDRTCPSPM